MLERSEPVSKLGHLMNSEITKNKLVECFLLCGDARKMLLSLVRQRHLDDPGIAGRGLAPQEALLLQQL